MNLRDAQKLHEELPPGYYRKSIKRNPLQGFWHNCRFRNIEKLIEPVDGPILDIGCADGAFTKVIACKSGAEIVYGIDVMQTSIDDNRAYFKRNKKMKFLLADAHKLPFRSGYFEAVFCLEALEHFLSPQKVLGEAKRVLRPGGYLITLVPTDSLLIKICWWVVLRTWGKHWRQSHIQSFDNRNRLADNIRKAGFKVVEDTYFLLGMLNAVKAVKE